MMESIVYRNLREDEIERNLFNCYERRQVVTKCRRKIEGEWQIKDVCFIDDWSEAEYVSIVADLKQIAKSGGCVLGAFSRNELIGFASVSPEPFGSECQYLDLFDMHVSRDMRGMGIGRKLFREASDRAKALGAKKLYISGHSSVESQAFYHAMGCVEALEYDKAHVEKEPYDCQLEYDLYA